MISFLKGDIIDIETNSIVLELNIGLGYQVFLTDKNIKRFKIKDKLSLYTVQIFREDSANIYGFLTKEEKILFNIILSVSGIGPKLALEVVNTYDLEDMKDIIEKSDIKSLTLISGVGKKVAERMNIELKDKFSKIPIMNNSIKTGNNLRSTLISALENLGFNNLEINEVLDHIFEKTPNVKIEDALKLAIQKLSMN